MNGITGRTGLIGVFGHPVAHSLSPVMHNAAIMEMGLDYVYLAFDVDPLCLAQAVEGIRALGMVGINVTIPHKEGVAALLDDVSAEASLIGSVNTIVNRNGRLLGETTDGLGFLRALVETAGDVRGKRAVVIGAGGSARAVLHALITNGVTVTMLNRTRERGEKLASEMNAITGSETVQAGSLSTDSLKKALPDADLLVNCTSVGMWPRADESPCPAELLRPGLAVYDLVYNPLRTRLLWDAEKAGATPISGLKMLVSQGAASFRMWTGFHPPVEVMQRAASAWLVERQAQEG